MIQSFINSPVVLTANDSSVAFQTDDIRTGSCRGCQGWLCHNQGSVNYDITKGGVFPVHLNISASSATARNNFICTFQ